VIEIYVYKNRDNPVIVELVAEAREGAAVEPDPPLQSATKVTLKTDNSIELDTDNDPDRLEMLDDTRLEMVLGPEFADVDYGLRGYLSVFYSDTPNGVAWPGHANDPDEATFLFIPVPWPS